MPKGSKCSFCNQLTLHKKDVSGSFRKCSTLADLSDGGVLDPVRPGSGKGYQMRQLWEAVHCTIL